MLSKLPFPAAAAALVIAGAMPAAPAHAGLEPFVGEMMLAGYNFCPRGYLPAAGQLLPISQNEALYSLLGTTYGGDGRTTFALPDLRGRTPVGSGQGPGLSDIRIGAKSGAEQVTMSQAQLPSHTHSAATTVTADVKARATSQTAGAISPAGNVLAGTGSGSEIYDAGPADQNMGDSAIQANVSATTTVSPTGGSQPVNIRDPYLGMNWCIATQGIYPSRS